MDARALALAAAAFAALVVTPGCRTAQAGNVPKPADVKPADAGTVPPKPSPAPAATGPTPVAPPAKPAVRREGPVTHLGRTVLPSCHRMFVGRVEGRVSAVRGLEVLRVSEDELLWGPPRDPDDEGRPHMVSIGEEGVAPAPGRRVLVLARLLPSGNFEAVQIGTVDETDGAAKLATFRRTLDIEALRSWDERSAALRAALRADLGSDDRWQRAYAVREMAAFADAFPGALGPDDVERLAEIEPLLTDSELRRLAASARGGGRRP
ncbi:MAG: hypothetical protein HMLKMBBP_03334 [Planctomycetes bacterium]|nr:hypothetical protein [Planctomycetota bacterium]